MNPISKVYEEVLTSKESKSMCELVQYFPKQLFAYLYSSSYELIC